MWEIEDGFPYSGSSSNITCHKIYLLSFQPWLVRIFLCPSITGSKAADKTAKTRLETQYLFFDSLFPRIVVACFRIIDVLVDDHVFSSNLERIIILQHETYMILSASNPIIALNVFSWHKIQHALCSVSLLLAREFLKDRCDVSGKKHTHIFWSFLEGGQYTVESYCPSAMWKFGKVAWESFKWSFCWPWHVTRSNNNTKAKYVLNSEECIYIICTNPQNPWKNLNSDLERKIPFPKGVSFWCFTHFETAEISVKTMGGEVPQKERFRGNILINHIRWSTYLAPPEQVLVR